ncbi:MAG: AAA family ATPase [bacterium]|nr:AAA family ATPase [bacterium]
MMTLQEQAASRGDPFAQLDLALSGARAPESEEPTQMRSEAIVWTCKICFCKDAQRLLRDGMWYWACDTCGTKLNAEEIAVAATQTQSFNTPSLQAPKGPHRQVKIFDHEQLMRVVRTRDAITGDSGDKRRIEVTLAKLLEQDEARPLALPGPAYEATLEELSHAFPAFDRVISEVVAPSLSILAAGGFVRPAPVLLVGSPGIGKTFFLQSLATALAIPLVKQDMSSTTTGASLSGLGIHWANSSPGSVFRALAFGKPNCPAVANPLFLLDELDKCAGDQRFDPLGPLHALLEEESAGAFEDESLPGVTFNVAEVRWVATANSVRGIPAPILSRFHIIEIEDPTRSERIELAERIFASAVRAMRLREFADAMPDSMLDRAAEMPPREFKRISQMAVGRALARGDFQPRSEDFEIRGPVPKHKMGF